MKVDLETPELVAWLEYWNGLTVADWKDKGYTHSHPPRVGAMYAARLGSRIRVWFGSEQSAVGFIDRATGDIYYAASYSRPAKHARGNLFDADGGQSAIGSAYGIRMLR